MDFEHNHGSWFCTWPAWKTKDKSCIRSCCRPQEHLSAVTVFFTLPSNCNSERNGASAFFLTDAKFQTNCVRQELLAVSCSDRSFRNTGVICPVLCLRASHPRAHFSWRLFSIHSEFVFHLFIHRKTCSSLHVQKSYKVNTVTRRVSMLR